MTSSEQLTPGDADQKGGEGEGAPSKGRPAHFHPDRLPSQRNGTGPCCLLLKASALSTSPPMSMGRPMTDHSKLTTPEEARTEALKLIKVRPGRVGLGQHPGTRVHVHHIPRSKVSLTRA